MDPSGSVDWICAHADFTKAALIWLFGVIPVASAMTWFRSFYAGLPYWAQSLLHLAAGNILHAFDDPASHNPLPPPPQP